MGSILIKEFIRFKSIIEKIAIKNLYFEISSLFENLFLFLTLPLTNLSDVCPFFGKYFYNWVDINFIIRDSNRHSDKNPEFYIENKKKTERNPNIRYTNSI